MISEPGVDCSEIDEREGHGVNRCMKNRCRRILQLAICTNNHAIILGAYGCDAFHDKPGDISRIFNELLVDEFYGMFFTKIVFEIKGKQYVENHNYNAFKSAFE